MSEARIVALVRAAPGFASVLVRERLGSLEQVSAEGLGEPVIRHRTSWVRRVELAGRLYYVKTYDYPTLRDRLRGTLRNTWLGRSRAMREWEALAWMRASGFPAPEPMAVFERRRLGLLHRATLITAAYPGEPLDRILPGLQAAVRRELLDALHRFVTALHRAGFRDRNLDLRNLLARPRAGGFEIVKIDSPRYRLVRPGRTADRLARADWRRLAASARAAGLEAPGGIAP